MMYYLLFILYLFYAREMMLDKKQIWVIYLFEFKMGNKAVEKTCNINNVFHPGPADEPCSVPAVQEVLQRREPWR